MKKMLEKVFLIISLLLFSANSFALNMNQAIDLAIDNSTEIKIEGKKTELSGMSRMDAATMFLPNASFNYRDGKRTTEISGLKDRQDDVAETFNISQPLFRGFTGVSKVAESIYQTKSSEQDLSFKKNQIAQQLVESYSNILKYRKIIDVDNELATDYERLVKLASQRLSLKDIDYNKFSEYELQSRRVRIDSNQDKISLGEFEAKFFNLTSSKPDNLESPQINYLEYKLEDILAFAIDKNPKIKSANLNYKAKKAAVAAETGKMLPQVSMNLQYENQKSSYYFNGENLKNRSVYLNFSVPIFQSGSEYSAIIKANKERQIANLEKTFAVQEIEKQVNIEYQKYQTLRENFLSLKKSFEIDFEALKLAKERFNKKDIGLMEYLEKKVSATQTHRQLIIAEYEMIISHYNLKFLINEIVN